MQHHLPVGIERDRDLVFRDHAAGRLDKQRAADTAKPAARRRLGAPRRKTVPVGERQRLVQTSAVVAAVILGKHRAGGDAVGKSIGRDQIAAAQFDPVDPGLARRLIHQTLDHVCHVRPARAAIGGDRHGVGNRQAIAAIHRRNAITAGRHAGRVQRVDQRAGGDRMGALIREPLVTQREESSLRIQRQRAGHHQPAPMIVGQKRLGTAGDPFHRPAGHPRRQRQGHMLRIRWATDAEAAADILRADANALRRQPALRGHAVAHCRHALSAGPQIQRLAVPARERSFRLHRIADDPAAGQRQPHDKRGGGEGGVGRGLIAVVEIEAEVAGHGLVDRPAPRRRAQPRRPPPPAAPRTRPRSVPPILGLMRRRGHHHRHRLTRRSGHDQSPVPDVAAHAAPRRGPLPASSRTLGRNRRRPRRPRSAQPPRQVRPARPPYRSSE